MSDLRTVIAKEQEKQEDAERRVARQAPAHLSLKDGAGAPEVAKWPEPPSPAAYRGLAGEICAAIDPHTEADKVAILIQFLLAFGNVIGRRAHFVAESTKHFLNLFALLVGVTSKGRKGSSWAQVRRVFNFIEQEWAEYRILSGLSSGEGLIWAVRDKIEKLEPVKSKGRVIDYQNVVMDEGVGDKRLVILEEEFSSALSAMARQGNTLSPIIRRAWDTGNLESLTKNSPARATDAHISIIGHITRNELLRTLTHTEHANGFTNRFLIVAVRRSKHLPEGGDFNEVYILPLLGRLEEAVKLAREEVDEMRRDDEAKQLWHEVYPKLSEGKMGMLGAITSRAEAQTMRLACIYALLDCSPVVRRTHLESALALWDYVERSSGFIFGDSLGDPVADELLKLLRDAGERGLTRTEVSGLFSRHNTQARARSLQSLAEAGLIRAQKEETGGRPVERFFAISPAAT